MTCKTSNLLCKSLFRGTTLHKPILPIFQCRPMHTIPTIATATEAAAATGQSLSRFPADTSATARDQVENSRNFNNCNNKPLSDKELLQHIYSASHQYIQNYNTRVTLKDLLETPLLDEYAGGVIISEEWIERELLHRIAKQVFLCDTLPLGLNLMPSISNLRELYVQSYVDLMNLMAQYRDETMQMSMHGRMVMEDYTSQQQQQQQQQQEGITTQHFMDLFSEIHERHHKTLHLAAEGMNELKASLKGKVFGSQDVELETIFFEELQSDAGSNDALQSHLDELCKTHIGISMLLQHHVELFYQYNPISPTLLERGEHQKLLFGQSSSSFEGIVCKDMAASKVLQCAIEGAKEHVRLWYECQHGANMVDIDRWMPRIRVNHVISPEGKTQEPTFAYVPQNLYFILYELLKNSLVAVIEAAEPEWGEMPSGADTQQQQQQQQQISEIEVSLIQNVSNEDLCVKISDHGEGIPRSKVDRIFRYMLTHDSTEESPQFKRGHLALANSVAQGNSGGLGMGLLSAKHFAEFFDGSLQVHSLESFGTDIYLHIATNSCDEKKQ